jgi:hypothetical protein
VGADQAFFESSRRQYDARWDEVAAEASLESQGYFVLKDEQIEERHEASSSLRLLQATPACDGDG